MTHEEWIAEYGRCWEEADSDGVVALFTEDAVYRVSPFLEPNLGHAGIRGYWARVTATQAGVRVRFGDPIAANSKVAVEWWTTMTVDGEEVTLPGCLLLRLAPDGRCEELREYWFFESGLAEPPDGWGQ